MHHLAADPFLAALQAEDAEAVRVAAAAVGAGDREQALVKVARAGKLALVQALLPSTDARAQNSLALRVACASGNVDVVRALLPHSDPQAEKSQALLIAAKCGATAIVETLLEAGTPDPIALGAIFQFESPSAAITKLLAPLLAGSSLVQDGLCKAAQLGNAGAFRELLACRPEEAVIANALRAAAAARQQELVQEYLPLLRTPDALGTVLAGAAEGGDVPLVHALLPQASGAALAQAITSAAASKRDDVVAELLPRCQEQSDLTAVLADAARAGRDDLFQRVFERIAPETDCTPAFAEALRGGRPDLAERLLPRAQPLRAAENGVTALDGALYEIDSLRWCAQQFGAQAVSSWEAVIRFWDGKAECVAHAQGPGVQGEWEQAQMTLSLLQEARAFCAAWRAREVVDQLTARPTP